MKITLVVLIILGAAGGWIAYQAYHIIYQPNVKSDSTTSHVVFLPTGSNFEDLVGILEKSGLLKDVSSFRYVARLKKFGDPVKPGRYRIMDRMSNNQLVNLFRAGLQEPVSVTFNSVRSVDQIISRVCKKIEADSTELSGFLHNETFIREKLGLREETLLTLFIPNTYEFNWNTSAMQFIERMQTEYKKFWTEERKSKAAALNLSQSQVSILASIVQAEQLTHPEERPVIAGLYLNRLKIGMPLQSDPTLIFAAGDFSANRVLNIHKEIDSPYNTYLHTGLPPGPINLPDISSIEAVLNPDKNNYLYMCAKEDFTGYHHFTRSLDEHNRNAAKYRNALNKRKIYK